MLQWLEPLAVEVREGRPARLLRKVFDQQYVVVENGGIEPIKVHGPGAVQNPHDPQAQWSAKGRGASRKEWVGYKVQIAESFQDGAAQTLAATAPSTEEEKEPPPSGSLNSMIGRNDGQSFWRVVGCDQFLDQIIRFRVFDSKSNFHFVLNEF